MTNLPIQNDKPEVVFIFGAGASYSSGVPLQSEIIPEMINGQDPQLQKSKTGQKVKTFLKNNFSHKERFPSLEEVFGFIDYFLINNLSLSKDWGVSELYKIKVELTQVIHYLISKNTKESNDFRKFWKTVVDNNRKIGVITTNYDTLLDDAFDKVYPECLIDYCLDFVNYRHPDIGEPFWWWVDPTKPYEFSSQRKPTRIKLIKIHGSLNWKYCNCCGQVALTPWDHKLDLKTNTFDTFIGKSTTVRRKISVG